MVSGPNGRLRVAGLALAALSFGLADSGRAEVVSQSDSGFVSRNVIEVHAAPEVVWTRLLQPAQWWSSEQTFSGNAANLTLSANANGCFCEKLPPDKATLAHDPHAPAGSVEHMHVVLVDPARALRMVGAIGPLQSEAVTATLTVTLKPEGSGTRVLMEYVVAGFMRYEGATIAPAIDRMFAKQLASLAARLGGAVSRAAPAATVSAGGLIRKSGHPWSLPAIADPAAQAAPLGPPAPADAVPAAAPVEPPAPIKPAPPAKAARPGKAAKTAPVRTESAPEPAHALIDGPAGPRAASVAGPIDGDLVATPRASKPATPAKAPEQPAVVKGATKPKPKVTPPPASAPTNSVPEDINAAFDSALGNGANH